MGGNELDAIKKEISSDRLEAALEALGRMPLSDEDKNTLIQIAGRFHALQRERMGGTLSSQDQELSANKIRWSLLQLAELIDKREYGGPRSVLPPLELVLRKGKDEKPALFRASPRWVDFAQGYVARREESEEVLDRLEEEHLVLVVGRAASGKTNLLKQVGFALAQKGHSVYFIGLRRTSAAAWREYTRAIEDLRNPASVVILDDIHLHLDQVAEFVEQCQVRELPARIILGSRDVPRLRGTARSASAFEPLPAVEVGVSASLCDRIHRLFLKKTRPAFSEQAKRALDASLFPFKTDRADLWLLAMALQAADPATGQVDRAAVLRMVYRDIKESQEAEADRPPAFLERLLLAVSAVYRFEVPVRQTFLADLELPERDLVWAVANGRLERLPAEPGLGARYLLPHSSAAGLYFEAFQAFPDLAPHLKARVAPEGGGDWERGLLFFTLLHHGVMDLLPAVAQWDEETEEADAGPETWALLSDLLREERLQAALLGEIDAFEGDIDALLDKHYPFFQMLHYLSVDEDLGQKVCQSLYDGWCLPEAGTAQCRHVFEAVYERGPDFCTVRAFRALMRSFQNVGAFEEWYEDRGEVGEILEPEGWDELASYSGVLLSLREEMIRGLAILLDRQEDVEALADGLDRLHERFTRDIGSDTRPREILAAMDRSLFVRKLKDETRPGMRRRCLESLGRVDAELARAAREEVGGGRGNGPPEGAQSGK